MKKRHLLRSSMVVGCFSFLGSLTGILVETSIAAKLGLSKSSDTFYVAFTVPYVITNLIGATGQFSLVPFFAAVGARHSDEELWRGFSYAANMVFLGLGAVAVVGAAAAPWVVRGIAPGLSPPQIELASQLGRWLFLIIIPAGVAETFRSFLLSQHRFALPSAAGLFRNVTVIAGILLGFSRYGEFSIVLGYLVGYFLQLAILGVEILVSFPVRYSLALRGTGEAFRKLRGAGMAQLGGAGLWQALVIVERMIASFLPPGTLTALNYGFKVVSTLAELLAGSVGTAGLPALSRAVARHARSEERKMFRDTIEISVVLLSPVVVFCLLLDRNIIRVIFERGNFTPDATSLMSLVFFYYSLSLLPFALVRLLTFCLFARQETQTFIRLSLFQYGLTIAFDLFYVGVLRLGARSIPLGLLTGLLVTCIRAFHSNVAGLREALDRSLAVFILKNLGGCVFAAMSVWGLRVWIEAPRTALGNFVYLCMLCGAGSAVFLAVLAASRAIPFAQLVEVWQSAEDA
jgi:putative peptidoglycan lipid II flippase